MTTLVTVKICLSGFPAWVPDSVSFFNVEVFAVDVVWHIIVAVARHAQKFCVFIKSITAAGVGNQ